MLLSAVSAPMLISVPGRLLSIEAGRQMIGMLKAGKFARSCQQLVSRLVGRPAADDQQALDAVRLHGAGDGCDLSVGRHFAAGAQLRAAHRAPAVDAHPVEFLDLVFDQASEAIVHPQDDVPLVDGQPGRRVHGRVHARRGCARGQDRQAQAALAGLWRMGQGPEQGAKGAIRLIEAAASQRHGPLVVARRDGLGHRARLLDALHQRVAPDAVVAHADHLRLAVRPGRQQLIHGRGADQGAHPAVEGAGRAAALDVAQDRRRARPHAAARPAPGARVRAVIGLPSRSRAPSATTTDEVAAARGPAGLQIRRTSVVSQSSVLGGCSGMKA